MVSALTVLLLGEYRRQPGQGSYPKPYISVSSGGVIPVGGNVTIRCWHHRLGMRILLYKAGAGNYLTYTDPTGYVAEFPITSARREDGGSYTCRYTDRTDPPAYSELSNPVQIIVAEPSYPKTSISLSPSWGVSLGGAVAVWCRGQRQGVRFVLNEEGRHFQPVNSDRFEVVFPISDVRREDGGSYSCSYHSSSEPFNMSYPSDPVELVVRDPSLPRPNIYLSPTGVTAPGADVTIRCQGQHRDVRFFLHKAGDLNPQRHMDPAGAGAEFRIPSVGRQHGGSYSCSYRPRSEPFISSQPSDTVQLVVAGVGPGSAVPAPSPTPSRLVMGLCTNGMLRARLCPGHSRGDTRLESRDRVTGGFPSQGGAAAAGHLGRDPSPQTAVPALGKHKGVGANGC
ncbi:immunoglobulin superfamily member 1-like [Mauremys mutica]|uniref:immunoglobulin superfamily member 1-like n=1 Tax=Mauremys mutica TaxID=74926 RepID=UPI001D167B8E|nr:immunoglobulin superfamily member 1-like [Mauremys mutica]